MNETWNVFLNLIRQALRGLNGVSDEVTLSPETWEILLAISSEHEILPLIFEEALRHSSFSALNSEIRKKYREKAISIAVRQIVQTNEFLTLILHAQARGLDPIVLKGITVRSLYPKSMLRPSVDEDILVAPDQVEEWHAFLLSEGLEPDDPQADRRKADELSYHKPNSPTYIELHLSLFSSDSSAYGELNDLFEDADKHPSMITIEDVTLRTLSPTDHLLYLLCHAYKHFLHGGVGIRQVCDIGIFSEHYADEIDWDRVRTSCDSVRIAAYSAALFRIAERHLGFPMPAAFADLDMDEADMLEDILSGGLYGVNDINRAHSSTITLDAVASQKQGRQHRGALASVFLPLGSMRGRYPYLRRFPWLLPVAWTQRVLRYLTHRDGLAPGKPGETVRIGKERVELLREYGILD